MRRTQKFAAVGTRWIEEEGLRDVGRRDMASFEGAGIALAGDDDESWMHLDDDVVLPRQIKPPVKRGRGKLIMLEDILRNRKLKMKKRTKLAKMMQSESDSSGDDLSSEESEGFMKKHDNVEKMLDSMELFAGGESEFPIKWGERIFGLQNHFPDFPVSERDAGLISRIFKFKTAEGTGRDTTAESMASSGLLHSWAILEGRCDKTTARWMFYQMAFSNNECLEKATCKILCDLLTGETRDGKPVSKLKWLPSHEDIMDTFHIYGYLDSRDEHDQGAAEPNEKGVSNLLCPGEHNPREPTASDGPEGPPSNIRSVLQFLIPYFEARKWYHVLSIPAAEGLAVTLIRCQLDRCMLSSLNLLQSCVEALIHYFTDEEWKCSCEHIASAVSRISSTFVNNLRVAKSLHATTSRFGSLQRLVVLKLLSRRVEAKRDLSSPEDVVSIFKSVNVKDKMCKFLNLYYLLILADIYLWSDSSLQKAKRALAAWLALLKKCSTQISLHDPRPEAMKVRNWASFLSQKYQVEKMQTSSNMR